MSFRESADSVNQAILGAFGEPSTTPVTFYPVASATGIELAGVFEAAGRHVTLLDTGVPIETTEPRLFVRLVDLPDAAAARSAEHGDEWTAQGERYRCIGIEIDGYGGAMLTGRRV